MISAAALTENRTFPSAEKLARDVAEWLCGLAQDSDRAFAVSLSGGSTPRRLYECLAAPDIASRFPWKRTHWFWGDERFVPHDHPDSNYRMAREAFLSHVAVPAGNIHVVPTEGLSPDQAAIAYETTLNTASLFPGQPALQETRRWVVAVIGAKAEARITLTYPVIESSRDVAFVVTGQDKRQVVARAQAGDRTLPAAVVRPIGHLHWFTDRAAAPEPAK